MASEPARLSREEWIDGGLTLLLADGPGGVAVQRIARSLGATKGSFYWHFVSRDDLLAAVLTRWEVAAESGLIEAMATEPEPAAPTERAARLLLSVTTVNHRGQLRLLADPDPAVRAVVERVTERRISAVAALLRQAGVPTARARRRAILAYCAYLGHAQLLATSPAALPAAPAARRQVAAALAQLLAVDG